MPDRFKFQIAKMPGALVSGAATSQDVTLKSYVQLIGDPSAGESEIML